MDASPFADVTDSVGGSTFSNFGTEDFVDLRAALAELPEAQVHHTASFLDSPPLSGVSSGEEVFIDRGVDPAVVERIAGAPDFDGDVRMRMAPEDVALARLVREEIGTHSTAAPEPRIRNADVAPEPRVSRAAGPVMNAGVVDTRDFAAAQRLADLQAQMPEGMRIDFEEGQPVLRGPRTLWESGNMDKFQARLDAVLEKNAAIREFDDIKTRLSQAGVEVGFDEKTDKPVLVGETLRGGIGVDEILKAQNRLSELQAVLDGGGPSDVKVADADVGRPLSVEAGVHADAVMMRPDDRGGFVDAIDDGPEAARRPLVVPNPDDPSPMKLTDVLDNTADVAASTRMNRIAGGAGLAMGAVGLKSAIDRGDDAGIAVSGADVAVSGADLALDLLSIAGKIKAPSGLTSALGKANIGVMVADGIYQIANEKGDFINDDGSLGNKSFRTGAVVATAGTGIGLTAAAGTAVAGTVTTTAAGGLAAAAAPVVIPIAATVAVGYATDAMVQAHSFYDEVAAINKGREQVRINDDAQDRHDAPPIDRYRNLTAVAFDLAEKELGTRDLDRVIAYVEEREYATPEARAELREHIDGRIEKLEKIIKDNDSVLPAWTGMIDGDCFEKKVAAEGQLASLRAAQKEMARFEVDVRAYEQKRQAEATAAQDVKIEEPVRELDVFQANTVPGSQEGLGKVDIHENKGNLGGAFNQAASGDNTYVVADPKRDPALQAPSPDRPAVERPELVSNNYYSMSI